MSRLPDALLAEGHEDITVLDISYETLAVTRRHRGSLENRVAYIVSEACFGKVVGRRGTFIEDLLEPIADGGADDLVHLGLHVRAFAVTRIERVMTTTPFAYRHSNDIKRVCATLGAKQKFIKPHCSWQNGKVELLNRTLATEWAHRQPFTSNHDRATAPAPWLKHYNTVRRHRSLGGKQAPDQVPVTNVVAGYTWLCAVDFRSPARSQWVSNNSPGAACRGGH